MALSDIVVALRLNAKGFEDGLLKASRSVATSMRGIERDVAGFKKLGTSMASVGQQMTVGISVPLAAAGIAAFKFSTDFNKAMGNVGSLIPGNSARVKELKAAVQDMAIATGKSTADMAGGLYQVVSAFGDTADTAQILNINARAAAAGLATTEEAIALTSAVTKGYGDTSALAVQHTADLAQQTVTLGQTTFPELAAAIGKVVPLSSELGVSQQELFAVMATGTGVTGTASEVSTQLRGVLQSLMAPTSDMTVLLESLGLSSGKALLEQQGLTGALQTVTSAAEATGTPLQKYISSIEGQTLALSLSGSQADTFATKLAAMGDVAGTVDRAFAEQTTGINAAGFAWEQLKTKLTVVAQDVGDKLAPAFSAILDVAHSVVGVVATLAEKFAALPTGLQAAILGVTGLAIALGPVVLVVGQLMTAITTLGPVLAGLGPAFAAVAGVLTGPVGLIALIGVGLVGAYVALDNSFVKMKGTIGAQSRELASLRQGYKDGKITIDQYRESVRNLDPKVAELDDKQQAAADSAWDLHDKVIALKKELEGQGIEVDETGKSLQEYYDAMVAAKAANDTAKSAIAPTTAAVKEQTAAIELSEDAWFAWYAAASGRNWEPPPIKDFTEDIKAATAAMWDNMDAMVAAVGPVGSVGGAFEGLSGGILQSAEDLAKTTPKFEESANKTKTVWDDAMQSVSTNITNAAQKITGILIGTQKGSIGDAFKELGRAVVTSFTEPAIKAITDFINTTIKNLIDSLIGKDGVGGALGTLKDAFGGIFGSGGAAVGGSGGTSGAGGAAAGGGVGAAAGVAGAVTGAFFGGASMVSSFHIENDTGRIEWNTRKSSLHLQDMLTQVNAYLPKLNDILGVVLSWGGATGIFGQINDNIQKLAGGVAVGLGTVAAGVDSVAGAVAAFAERTGRVISQAVVPLRPGGADTESALIAAQVLDGYQVTDSRGGYGIGRMMYRARGAAPVYPGDSTGKGGPTPSHDPANRGGSSGVRGPSGYKLPDAETQEEQITATKDTTEAATTGLAAVVQGADDMRGAIVDARMAIVQAIGMHQTSMAEWFGRGISGIAGLGTGIVDAITVTRSDLGTRLDTIAAETRGVKSAIQTLTINVTASSADSGKQIADAIALRLQGVTV